MVQAGFFVTGTDTGVGKTLFCSELLRALARAQRRCTGMKPVASGAQRGPQGLRNDDAMALLQASSVKGPYDCVNPYCFEAAVAPHIAAHEAGVDINLDHIAACARALLEHCDWLVVEGVGGWRAPLGTQLTVADMATRLNLPVILVVGVRLGCLNHALLTLESIHRSGLPLAGWVGSQIEPEMAKIDENIAALSAMIGQPPLCMLPWKPRTGTLQLQMDAAIEALRVRR
jgi:dethiobiotin synthetase